VLHPAIWITFLFSVLFSSSASALVEDPDNDDLIEEVDEQNEDAPIRPDSKSSKSSRSKSKEASSNGMNMLDDSGGKGPSNSLKTINAPLSTPDLADIPSPPVPTIGIEQVEDSGASGVPLSLDIPVPSLDAYRIGVGDLLSVNVWAGDFFEEDFKGNYVVVDSGAIELPLVGRVIVSELSEEGAAIVVSNALRQFIVNPIVQLQVAGFNSQRISVLGAVQRPGVIKISGETTLLEALAERQLTRKKRANGAWAAQKVHLHRKSGKIVIIDLEDLLATAKGNAILSDGDMIYVSDGAYVYINGKVKQPGAVPFRSGMTVTDAIAEAGGSARGSNLTKVFIMRGEKRQEVNVKRIFQGRDKDVRLKEGDRLFIEESIW